MFAFFRRTKPARKGTRPRATSWKPRLEVLEDRTVLSATVFDVAADFSPTNNPNGVWSYGYSPSPGSSFVLDSYHTVDDNGHSVWTPNSNTGYPLTFYNGTDHPIVDGVNSLAPHQIALHPAD